MQVRPAVAVNPSHNGKTFMFQHDAYILLLEGQSILDFLDGLSTNHVVGQCSTIFTQANAKIIDVCEVLPVGEHVALIGYQPFKTDLIQHLKPRILEREITIRDISTINDVFVGSLPDELPVGSTRLDSFMGPMAVIPKRHEVKASWNRDQWDEHRILNLIPYHGAEITHNVHPYACGLDGLVHPNKGCYIGQEILTRMRSRGRQGKKLVRRSNPASHATTTGANESLCIERTQ